MIARLHLKLAQARRAVIRRDIVYMSISVF